MNQSPFPSVSLHNVSETTAPSWTDGGAQLCRVPTSVGAALNVDARERVRHPTGCEVRFVPSSANTTVAVTISAASRTVIRPFWGPFQPGEPVEIGPEPSTYEFTLPEHVRDLCGEIASDTVFDPWVCRLRFEAWTPVAIHGIDGAARPPHDDELPDRRYLAYGTSITEGASASAPHLTYVSRVARHLGFDALNFGMSGAAFCEPTVADYIAGRSDWDVATLALSVNMANRGFTIAQFRERASNLVRTVAAAHPEKPVVCVTLFPYHADVVCSGDFERAADFRTALHTVVEATSYENLYIIEGRELMDATGLTTDVLHPGDAGMLDIGRLLAVRLDWLLN